MIDSDSYKRAQAINSLKPGAEFTLRGNTLEWHDKVQTQPTDSEITAEINRLKIISDYQTPRKKAYPSIQDQLDMQYWDSVNGTTTWKDAIAKVKSDNPKP